MKTKRKNGSIKRLLLGFLIETVAISLFLVLISISLYMLMREEDRRTSDQMLFLNDFYTNLEEINRDVYTYTLEGDEQIYRKIADASIENRSLLSRLADLNVSRTFYRSIRDAEEMFLTYTTCIGKIYDHSYLCEELTVGSKSIINRYYSETQKVYDALSSEFQGLYTELLNAMNARRDLDQKKHMLFLLDLIGVVAFVLVYQARRIRSLTYRVIHPVQALTESAGTFGDSDMEVVRYVEQEEGTEEEMQKLIEVYNSMILRIQMQIRTITENASAKERLKDQELENLRMRNLLKTSELKALQMQINPHFLFNTLNMISQTAYLEHSDQTVCLLDSTARLLRYTLDNSGKAVTLAKEIEILGHYVELQEYRFGDRIQFEFDLDESFHQMMVPSMILQPLAENALIHGVGMKTEGAWVLIRTRYDGKNGLGIIEIADNGAGMTEEELCRVRKEMEESGTAGKKIGLANIAQRVKLFFGQRSAVEIRAVPGKGTIVRLLLPYEDEKTGEEGGGPNEEGAGKDYVEDTDSRR